MIQPINWRVRSGSLDVFVKAKSPTVAAILAMHDHEPEVMANTIMVAIDEDEAEQYGFNTKEIAAIIGIAQLVDTENEN